MGFRQVDVSAKPTSYRRATAIGTIRLKRGTVKLIREGKVEKGDPIALASLTGVMAAKRTPEIVALCHPLKLDGTEVRAKLLERGVQVTAVVTAQERTGVEMEALTAVAVGLLNVWDVVKQYEKDAEGQYPSTAIEDLRVVRKVKRAVKRS